jgi:hypothetical protein
VSEDFPLGVLGPRQVRFLLHLASRIVPETAAATPEVRRRLVAVVDDVLQRQSSSQQFQFKLLLLVLRWMTVPFTLHRLESLPPSWQDFLLRRLEGAPLTILRVGIWGLKTLVFMGYYGQEAVTARIHYEPSKRDGNGILHALQGSRKG